MDTIACYGFAKELEERLNELKALRKGILEKKRRIEVLSRLLDPERELIEGQI